MFWDCLASSSNKGELYYVFYELSNKPSCIISNQIDLLEETNLYFYGYNQKKISCSGLNKKLL